MTEQGSESEVQFEPLSELDRPMQDVLDKSNRERAELALIGKRMDVYFKFTCEACRSRQTFELPNTLYVTGKCGECGHVTNLRRRGCGYLVHIQAAS